MHQKDVFTLYWMLLAAGIATAASLLWWHGLFHQLYQNDVSRLSSVILLAFLLASCHAAICVFRFSAQTAKLRVHDEKLKKLPMNERARHLAEGRGLPHRFQEPMAAIARRGAGDEPGGVLENAALVKMLDSEIKAPVRLGWLLSDLLIKLGLLGTVVGFIIMLGAITGGGSVDISNIDMLLADMGSGMRVALFTTLTGLSSGTLLGFQYYIVERSADVLMLTFAEIVELRLSGAMKTSGSS